jgi:hypothetical protein
MKSFISLLLAVLFLLFFPRVRADKYVDSLKYELSKEHSDVELVSTINLLAKHYRFDNLDSCAFYANMAIQVASPLGLSSLLVDSYYYLASYQNMISNFDSAQILIRLSFDNFDSIHDTRRYIRNKLVEIDCFTEKFKLVKAYKQLNILDGIKNKTPSEKIEIEIAFSYLFIKRKQINLAQERLLQIKDLVDQSTDIHRIVKFYILLAYTYSIQGYSDISIHYLTDAYLLSQKANNEFLKIKIASNLSEEYKGKGEFYKALHYLRFPSEYYKTKDFEEYLNAQCRLADLYILVGDLDSAYHCLNIVKRNKKKIQKDITRLLFFNTMNTYYTSTGDCKNAYVYLTKFYSLDDSLYSISSAKELNDIRIKYETEKKEKEIILLTKEKTEEKVKKQKVFYLWIATFLALVALSTFFILFRKNVNHRRALSKARNEQLEKDNRLKEQEKIRLEQEKRLKDLENKSLKQENQLLESQKDIAAQKLRSHKNIITSINNSLFQQSQLTEVLIDALKSLKPYSNKEGKDRINTYLADLSGYSRDKNWQTFEQNFILIYPDFFNELERKYPTLTKTEKKLCAFIKMGLQTPDITRITLQSKHSVYQIKSRLREKFAVKDNVELSAFICNFDS